MALFDDDVTVVPAPKRPRSRATVAGLWALAVALVALVAISFLPFLGGERSTGWNPEARGTIHGLTFETTPLDVRQAAFEGVAFRFAAMRCEMM